LFNTNTFYFTPVVTGELGGEGDAIWRGLDKRVVKDTKAFRAILPDPLTLAELSEDHYYGTTEKLMYAYAEILHQEVRSLEGKGVVYVQLSSPSLAARFRGEPFGPDLLSQLGEALRIVVRGTSLRTGFHTLFGDASRLLPLLFDVVPTDDIGFDLSETAPESLVPSNKGIIAGVSDGRTTYLEPVSQLKTKVESLSEATGSKRITLSPSCDLRFIPRVWADQKLKVLGSLKDKLVAN